MAIQNVKEMTVYQQAYRQAMDFFSVSKQFFYEEHTTMTERNREIGKMLGAIIKNPEKFLLTPAPRPLTPDA